MMLFDSILSLLPLNWLDATALACAAGETDRRSLFDKCQPQPIGPAEAFTWADGDPVLATAVLQWMREAGVDKELATRAALAVRGQPVYTPPPQDPLIKVGGS